MEFRELAVQLMAAAHPKEKRRPTTALEKHERVKDGTMRYLLEHDCVASPGELCEFFDFSQARLSKVLSELERDGLVVRRSDAADRRRVIVHLTEQGLAFAVERQEQLLEHMTAMLEALGSEDAAHFVRIMEKLQTMQGDSPCMCGTGGKGL